MQILLPELSEEVGDDANDGCRRRTTCITLTPATAAAAAAAAASVDSISQAVNSWSNYFQRHGRSAAVRHSRHARSNSLYHHLVS